MFTIRTPKIVATGLLAGFAALSMSACTTSNNVVANVAKAAFEDRLAEEQVIDAKIKAAALDRLLSVDKVLVVDINIDVWKTHVMASGTLSDTSLHHKATAALRQDGRIARLYDEVQIVSADAQSERREWKEKAQATAQKTADKAAEVFDDFWIETKISAQLIAADGIKSVNYRWRSVLGTVYLLGEAQSAQELNLVKHIIKNIKGVRALTTHVQLRG
ncbi:BON domain-containing protein [Pseudomonadota bacterium]